MDIEHVGEITEQSMWAVKTLFSAQTYFCNLRTQLPFPILHSLFSATPADCATRLSARSTLCSYSTGKL